VLRITNNPEASDISNNVIQTSISQHPSCHSGEESCISHHQAVIVYAGEPLRTEHRAQQ
jgi:hypothetical protein